MELYSWQNSNGNWVFAVVGGTNRLKTEAEIKKKENQIGSMDQLSQVFEKLAEHEQVYWFHRKLKGFAYPDEKMVDSIASLARKANVDLYVPPKSERNE